MKRFLATVVTLLGLLLIALGTSGFVSVSVPPVASIALLVVGVALLYAGANIGISFRRTPRGAPMVESDKVIVIQPPSQNDANGNQ